MLSKLELFTEACARLDKRRIVMQEKRCLRKRHFHSSCLRCSLVCPNGAITCLEGLVFAVEKCTGCGACASVCPSGALSAELPSNKELRSLVARHIKSSGAVAFACEVYLKAQPAERHRTIAVPCIARCDESILVDAVLQGAIKVAIINAACTDCQQHKICDLVQTMADTANRLLGCWNYPAVIALTRKIPEIIKPLSITEGEAAGISRRAFLTEFRKKSTSLFTQVLPEVMLGADDKRSETNGLTNAIKEAKNLPEKWRLLVNSLNSLQTTAATAGFSSKLWGNISIADSCNGCGVCADSCPTSAIVVNRQNGLWSLSFDAASCTQCGLCQDICCHKSIKITSTVDLGEMLAPASRILIVKRQEEIDTLLEPIDQRMARLLGCMVKN